MLIVLGHDGRRVAQMMAPRHPLSWPVRSQRVHRIRMALVWLWAMTFALDAVTCAYLLDAYQGAPDDSLVQCAAANTNASGGNGILRGWSAPPGSRA
jgi:heptose-I-phosphate ethanolaminephosphotransferase